MGLGVTPKRVRVPGRPAHRGWSRATGRGPLLERVELGMEGSGDLNEDQAFALDGSRGTLASVTHMAVFPVSRARCPIRMVERT